MRILSSLLAASVVVAGVSPLFADSIIYLDDSSGALAKVDADTGAATLIGNSSVVLTDIAMNSLGDMYGISFTNLYLVNTISAQTTNLGSFGSGINDLNALTFSSNGTLYAAGNSDTKIYTINTATGAATALSGSTGVYSAGDLAFNNGNLYESDTNGDLDKINLSPTVSETVVGSFDITNADQMYGLATGTDGVLYGVDGTAVYTISTATGKANLLSNFGTEVICKDGAQVYGATAAFSLPPVPEPASLAFLAVGGLALLYKWKGPRKHNA